MLQQLTAASIWSIPGFKPQTHPRRLQTPETVPETALLETARLSEIAIATETTPDSRDRARDRSTGDRKAQQDRNRNRDDSRLQRPCPRPLYWRPQGSARSQSQSPFGLSCEYHIDCSCSAVLSHRAGPSPWCRDLPRGASIISMKIVRDLPRGAGTFPVVHRSYR